MPIPDTSYWHEEYGDEPDEVLLIQELHEFVFSADVFLDCTVGLTDASQHALVAARDSLKAAEAAEVQWRENRRPLNGS